MFNKSLNTQQTLTKGHGPSCTHTQTTLPCIHVVCIHVHILIQTCLRTHVHILYRPVCIHTGSHTHTDLTHKGYGCHSCSVGISKADIHHLFISLLHSLGIISTTCQLISTVIRVLLQERGLWLSDRCVEQASMHQRDLQLEQAFRKLVRIGVYAYCTWF